MSATYDKIGVKWITPTERRFRLNINDRSPEAQCHECAALFQYYSRHLINEQELYLPGMKDRVEEVVRRRLLAEIYKPIIERRERIMRLRQFIEINNRDMLITAIDEAWSPIQEIMEIVSPTVTIIKPT